MVRFGYGFHLKAKLFSTSRLACLARWSYLHGIALPDFYIISSFFYKKSKQARVHTFVCLFRDDASIAKGPGCDEGTNLRLRDFAVVPLMPTRGIANQTTRCIFTPGTRSVFFSGIRRRGHSNRFQDVIILTCQVIKMKFMTNTKKSFKPIWV